ncbi:hypothetical protein KKF55_03210 [Patescibacteria group bacterium]|nr:hypothetical protein [Patescibacteria group bacterium]
MNKYNDDCRLLSSGFAVTVGALFLTISGSLIVEHIQVLKDVQNVSVPLVAQLTELERRESALEEQVELSQIHAAVQVGSIGEKLDMYVLPKETDLDRLVAVFDLLFDNLSRYDLVSGMSDIEIGDVVSLNEGDVSARSLTVRFAAHEEGINKILYLTQLAGLLTVGDALSDDEVELLFRSTEDENPAGIVALEQFLSLDLMRYAQDVRAHEDQLKRSFASEAFSHTLQSVTQGSKLRDARRLFEGDFGKKLDDSNLWPLQFLTIREVELKEGGAEGWYRLSLELLVWERS